MPTDYMKAGKRLKEYRERSGMNLSEFAKKIGFSKSYLSNIENGKKPPTLHILKKAADALGEDLSVFLIDETSEPFAENEQEKWYLFGKTLEKQGITFDDVKEWVEIAKSVRKKNE